MRLLKYAMVIFLAYTSLEASCFLLFVFWVVYLRVKSAFGVFKSNINLPVEQVGLRMSSGTFESRYLM